MRPRHPAGDRPNRERGQREADAPGAVREARLHRKNGGGSTWITGSFDPEMHTVFWGIGNPGPFNATGRPGDDLYTCSVLALDPKTGKDKVALSVLAE